MQTFKQSFTADSTWELNVSGKYFTTLECSKPVSVRFYMGGKLLDLGEIKGLMAGLECTMGEISGPHAFDRVQIDVKAWDSVMVGIGNGQSRYNRGVASVEVVASKQPRSSNFSNQAKAVDVVSGVLLDANPERQYLMVQNNDVAATLYIAFGKPATAGDSLRVIPGGAFEMIGTQTTQSIHCMADIATANVVTVEG